MQSQVKELSRLCAVVALSCAMPSRRRSAVSVGRSLYPRHLVSPNSQYQLRRVRAGRTARASRTRNSPGPRLPSRLRTAIPRGQF